MEGAELAVGNAHTLTELMETMFSSENNLVAFRGRFKFCVAAQSNAFQQSCEHLRSLRIFIKQLKDLGLPNPNE